MFTEAAKKWADYPALVTSKDETYTYKQYYENAKLYEDLTSSRPLGSARPWSPSASRPTRLLPWSATIPSNGSSPSTAPGWLAPSPLVSTPPTPPTPASTSSPTPALASFSAREESSSIRSSPSATSSPSFSPLSCMQSRAASILSYWPEDGFKEIETNDKVFPSASPPVHPTSSPRSTPGPTSSRSVLPCPIPPSRSVSRPSSPTSAPLSSTPPVPPYALFPVCHSAGQSQGCHVQPR